jgi:hypothetical protein
MAGTLCASSGRLQPAKGLPIRLPEAARLHSGRREGGEQSTGEATAPIDGNGSDR